MREYTCEILVGIVLIILSIAITIMTITYQNTQRMYIKYGYTQVQKIGAEGIYWVKTNNKGGSK